MDYVRTFRFSTGDNESLFAGYLAPETSGDTRFVLMDGLGCAGFAWRYLGKRFAELGPTLHWNYRGHGKNPTPKDISTLNIEHLAEDFWTLTEKETTQKVILVAHSLGAQVALEYARTHKDHVEALILIGGTHSHPTKVFRGTDILDKILPSLLEAAHKSPRLTKRLWTMTPASLAFLIARSVGELDKLRIKERDFTQYWEQISDIDPFSYLTLLQNAGKHIALDVASELNDIPTLLLAARNDTFVPLAHVEELHRHMPNSRFVVFEEGSHALPVELHDELWLEIESFLSENALS